MRPTLLLLFLAGFARAQEKSVFHVNAAVFSSEQAFWPSLASSAKSSPTSGPAAADDALRIAILPLRIPEKDWQERIPCDSCHRLSANAMEFFLENYLAERLRKRFPADKGHEVDLMAPHANLLKARKVNLLDFQDSLRFPFDRWFDGYGQNLIYRDRDRMCPTATVERMDRLGGWLGATHLLYPAKVWVKVDPKARDQHVGHLEWGFHLVFWNVSRGRAEWAMTFHEEARDMDLDASLESHLDRGLMAAWDRMPGDLMTLWRAEPR